MHVPVSLAIKSLVLSSELPRFFFFATKTLADNFERKMRKPDGIQTQDVIKTLTRKSISPRRAKSSLSPKRTKKDAYTTSSPPPVPLIPERSPSSRSASTRTANLSASSQSMRRKSTLPKANNRSRGKQEEVGKMARGKIRVAKIWKSTRTFMMTGRN